MTDRLLTARLVADRLGVTPATVLRWTRNGHLPAVRLPSGQIRYREDALDEWIERRATPDRGVLAAPASAARRLATVPSEALAAPHDNEEHPA